MISGALFFTGLSALFVGASYVALGRLAVKEQAYTKAEARMSHADRWALVSLAGMIAAAIARALGA